jgi:hypothetical protein
MLTFRAEADLNIAAGWRMTTSGSAMSSMSVAPLRLRIRLRHVCRTVFERLFPHVSLRVRRVSRWWVTMQSADNAL